jgi:hypothetical protein
MPRQRKLSLVLGHFGIRTGARGSVPKPAPAAVVETGEGCGKCRAGDKPYPSSANSPDGSIFLFFFFSEVLPRR